jgi:hypothetical protein
MDVSSTGQRLWMSRQGLRRLRPHGFYHAASSLSPPPIFAYRLGDAAGGRRQVLGPHSFFHQMPWLPAQILAMVWIKPEAGMPHEPRNKTSRHRHATSPIPSNGRSGHAERRGAVEVSRGRRRDACRQGPLSSVVQQRHDQHHERRLAVSQARRAVYRRGNLREHRRGGRQGGRRDQPVQFRLLSYGRRKSVARRNEYGSSALDQAKGSVMPLWLDLAVS